MKKKILLIVFILCLFIISLLIIKRNDIYHQYINNKIKEKVIKELNGEFDKNTADFTIRGYKVYIKTNEELNHYDITKIIDIYLDINCEGVEICSMRNEGRNVEYGGKGDKILGNKFKLENSIDIEVYLEYGYSEDYDENDIINYKNGSFRNLLIEKLKTILDYEEKDGKIIWQINSVNDEVIELPNNFYLDYRSDKTVKNDRFKKAIDIIIDDNFSYSPNEGRINHVIVRYETVDGEIEEREARIVYTRKKYVIDLQDILCLKLSAFAKINLCNHTCDKVVEEKMREYELNDDFEPDSYR